MRPPIELSFHGMACSGDLDNYNSYFHPPLPPSSSNHPYDFTCQSVSLELINPPPLVNWIPPYGNMQTHPGVLIKENTYYKGKFYPLVKEKNQYNFLVKYVRSILLEQKRSVFILDSTILMYCGI